MRARDTIPDACVKILRSEYEEFFEVVEAYVVSYGDSNFVVLGLPEVMYLSNQYFLKVKIECVASQTSVPIYNCFYFNFEDCYVDDEFVQNTLVGLLKMNAILFDFKLYEQLLPTKSQTNQ